MESSVVMAQLGYALPLLFGGIGSALGIASAGRAAAGEWAKEGKAGVVQKFAYVILTSMPISQTIYGFLFMMMGFSGLFKDVVEGAPELVANYGYALFGLGLACGILQLASAWVQGMLGAAGCRMLSDSNGKGFVNIVIIMGVAETVGLLGFIFLYLFVPAVK